MSDWLHLNRYPEISAGWSLTSLGGPKGRWYFCLSRYTDPYRTEHKLAPLHLHIGQRGWDIGSK